ncbi:ParA family protein [uncultured Pseudokineococcus sp.]|uniref:ParA family protein n=1 Tax=uncultured Pseudokineococcus sp. TaxID=1642928 RepID=UPI0026033B0F|nr:ParA family protein [uncultured Pseudokineococcus sp.]
MDELRRTIAVMNRKGGVGKTTLAANVAGLLAAAGQQVLLVDLDPQGNLAEDLGYTGTDVDDEGRGLLTALTASSAPVPARAVRPNLDVIPGGVALEDTSAVLRSRVARDGNAAVLGLARALAKVAGSYDFVVLDCPPGEGVMQDAALAAARWLLVPTRSDSSSRKGLRQVADRFAAARELNPDLELLGVVLFAVTKSATRIDRRARENLAADLGGAASVLTASVRYAEAAAADARERGQLMHELEGALAAQSPWYVGRRSGTAVDEPALPRSASTVAADLQLVAEEIVELLLQREQQQGERGGAQS